MRRSILILLVCSLPILAAAQRYFGIATSNWSGTNSLYLNPANIADSRHKFVIDIASVNFGLDNNLATINTGNALHTFFGGDSLVLGNLFNFGSKQNFSMMAPYGEVRGPGLMVSINHKHSLALTTRIRAFDQFHNFSQSLYRTILDQQYRDASGNYDITAGKFNWTLNMWSEIGLSYGGVLYDNGKNEIKVGATVRYLSGIAYAAMKSDHMDAHYDSSQDQLSINNTNLDFASNIISTEDQLSNGIGGADLFNRFFGSKGGHGLGMDLGVVYEYRPNYRQRTYDMDGQTGLIDYSHNNYKLRISVAVTDIGSMNYKTGNKTVHFSGNGTLVASDIADSVKNYTDLTNYAKEHGFTVDTSSEATRVHLPTALVLGVDYHIYKRFYANLTYVGNLANRGNYGNSYYSQVTVTPRYDTRVFSAALPITYSMLTQGLKVGLGVRVAGFFVGSDDMLAFFGNNQYGINVYFGGYIPINKKRPRDSDHDHVSNKRDKCPGIVGTWQYRGCPVPDRDSDGILDTVDKCPDVPGSPTAMGCPDKDMDSVADAVDRCPDEAGPRSLQGCPDRDGDGIADIDDTCPDQPGLALYHGCPDTDHDGIPDNEDPCPLKAGPAELHGCPDTDNDGIPDNKDKCPTVAGPASNFGCPVVKEEVKRRLAFAATAIRFQTGKSVIMKSSYSILDEIVKILNEYPDYYMTIDGYTDNVGNAAKNLQLSRDRANSVKAYFVSKGINTDRLVTNGYGEGNPVASNKTAAGRAKNRRVDMNLKLKGE